MSPVSNSVNKFVIRTEERDPALLSGWLNNPFEALVADIGKATDVVTTIIGSTTSAYTDPMTQAVTTVLGSASSAVNDPRVISTAPTSTTQATTGTQTTTATTGATTGTTGVTDRGFIVQSSGISPDTLVYAGGFGVVAISLGYALYAALRRQKP